MLSKCPILENLTETTAPSDQTISQDFIIQTLINYSKTPFDPKTKPQDELKKRKKKEMRKLLQQIIDLEMQSVDTYIRTLEHEDSMIWIEKQQLKEMDS